jgi:hypothetical protein
MQSFLDWIFEYVVEALGGLFSDRTGRRRRRRVIVRRWTTVPEVRDLTVADASDALTRAGLRMTIVRQTTSADPATGRVLDQDPLPWQAARRRHKVRLRI